MDLILRGTIRDPRVRDVLVSDVRVSDDLSHARVYVRTLNAADERKRADVVEGLERAAGFIRREIGGRLKIRYTPEFRFFWDDVVDQASHIEGILAEIREDAEAKEGDPIDPSEGSAGGEREGVA